MKVITKVKAMRAAADEIRRQGMTLGLVPTMGYFHDGHMSLMRRARGECDRVVVSLFVNPTQFGPNEDLERYPRDLARDEKLAAEAGVDILFVPAVGEMYPPGYATFVEVQRLSDVLCGERRPGHFRGVATVVVKLFQICRPTRAYFGRKDYQQAVIVKRLAADLNFEDLTVEVLPIVREPDGLAMSSRNVYLSPAERRQATALFWALVRAQELFRAGERDVERYLDEIKTVIASADGVRLDYAELVDGETLKPAQEANEGTVVAIAAFVGQARLIDNTVLGRDDLTRG